MPDPQDSHQRVKAAKESLHNVEDKVSDATHKAADSSKSALNKAAASFGLPVPVQEGEEKWVKVFDYCAQEIVRVFPLQLSYCLLSPTSRAQDDDGNKYMDQDQFINAVAPREDFIKIGKRQYGLLFRVADKQRKGLVSLEDFIDFQRLLKLPDAEFRVAFELFDQNQDGELSLEEFTRVRLRPYKKMHANVSSLQFVAGLFRESGAKIFALQLLRSMAQALHGRKELHRLQVGLDLSLSCSEANPDPCFLSSEFTQLVKGLQGERVRQAFQYLDPHQTGFISSHDFARVMREIAGHKLSDSVLERLPNFTSNGRISYAQLRAVVNVIKEIDMVENIVKYAVNSSRDSRIERDDFLDAASRMSTSHSFLLWSAIHVSPLALTCRLYPIQRIHPHGSRCHLPALFATK